MSRIYYANAIFSQIIYMKKISMCVKKALVFATKKHNGQYRKISRIPYVMHPIQVADLVHTYTDDNEIIAAALLHDVLEDCKDVSFKILQKEFGDRIARIVSEISLASKKKYKSWKKRKEAYLSKIKKASKEALIIVAVDKMTNFKTYFEALKKDKITLAQHFGGTPDEYRWYYTEIGNILISILGKHPAAIDYMTTWQLCQK